MFQGFQWVNHQPAFLLHEGVLQKFQQHFRTEEWARQVEERSIAREYLQDEAAVELLSMWSVRNSTRRQLHLPLKRLTRTPV